MSRNHDRERSKALFQRLQQITHQSDPSIKPSAPPGRELRKMKKFRFQLLHRWLTEHLEPCRVADIAGGKGLLAYLLQERGWEATVVDPNPQSLPEKYKDIESNQRIRVTANMRVPYVAKPFTQIMGQQFDLLIGMHAHGCNIAIIEASVAFGCGFVLLPCCVIDEPFLPPVGTDWLEFVADYAVSKGLTVTPFRLNFKGQNIGLYGAGQKSRRLKTAPTINMTSFVR